MSEEAVDDGATAAVRGAFKDPSTLLRWVSGMLIACSLAAFVALILRVLECLLLAQMASRIIAGADMMRAAQASDVRVEASSGLRAGIFLATCIPFGMWIYRANRNVRALGATDLKHSAGWAVGSYVVPFVNLVVPFVAMREIWRASLDPGNWHNARGTPLLGWWWFLWLANGASGWIAMSLLKGAHGIGMAQSASLTAAAQDIFQIALNVVAILLVRRITANQLAQAHVIDVF